MLTLAGHSGTVRCLNLNGNRLVSGSVDRSIKVCVAFVIPDKGFLYYRQTQKTVNAGNISGMLYCVEKKKPIRCEITKL